MSELGREARDLLSSARSAHDAVPDAKARVRARLAPVWSVPPGTESVLLKGGAHGRWLAAKVAALVAIGGVGVALFYAHGHPSGDLAPAAITAPASPAVAAPPAPVEVALAPSMPVVPTVVPADLPAPAASAPSLSPRARARPNVAPTHDSIDAAGSGSLAAEVSLLRRASTALHAGDPQAALAAVAEHARRFPAGALAEERDTERIVALCALDRRAEAARATERFERAYPGSSHEARIRAACQQAGVAP